MRLSLPSSLASKCAKEHRHGVPSLFAPRVHGASVPCLAAVCRATVFVFSIPCLAAVSRATVFVFFFKTPLEVSDLESESHLILPMTSESSALRRHGIHS